MSDILVQRCVTAAAYYHRAVHHDGGRCAIIVSGGDPAGAGVTEAAAMSTTLVQMGVPQEAVILEELATTTLENAFYCLPLIARLQGQMAANCISLVTSGFHIPRALYMFEAVFADKTHPHALAEAPRCFPMPSPSACVSCGVSGGGGGRGGGGGGGVTTMTLPALLEKEARCIQNRLTQHQIKAHIKCRGRGATPIAPLTPQRLAFALNMAETMLEAVKKDGDWAELPTFYRVATKKDDLGGGAQ